MIREVFKRFAAVVARAGVKFRLMPRFIVLNVDGGICSQMHFYLAGRMLEKAGQKVVYNLDWFEKDGKDTEGRFCRNYDLQKAFPELTVRQIRPGLAKRLYAVAFRYHNEYYAESDDSIWRWLQAPLYVKGYFRETDGMFGEIFSEIFRVDRGVLDERNRRKFDEIEEVERRRGACAVHVRRGDLAKFHDAYGQPAGAAYFRRACAEVVRVMPDVKFYMFSDEPVWCELHLLPQLGGYDIEICGENGSDKGWCDLLLMSRCRHQITSQGSMGRYAAALRPAELQKGLVVLTDNKELGEWTGRFANALVVASDSSGDLIL